jgi:hypothetical protein
MRKHPTMAPVATILLQTSINPIAFLRNYVLQET